ncbi:CoA transferase [Actinomycetospora endophytica]|uniref:CoA transferase n=1 Tax=Actinomycetospora endophytica TaxID=2291215 RepID=A0ABS8PFH9_9PSEU|nr:CaiB/BaiF CoA-transferase family protein [Actinomycetospora endophytica]MCD2195759.1 CoA transferase [Actinomycetospora endophytica]
MPGPLEGVRVVDLSSMLSGPWAADILGDQGADVVKVEPPGIGDHVRALPNRSGDLPAMFVNINRSKRSVVLDLKESEGKQALLRLFETADVVVQNFRPGVVDRLGIGYEAARAANPGVVYLSISGFGEEGPFANRKVYDPVVQALSGLTTIQAGSDEARPRLIRTVLPDKLTSVTAAQAVTAALLARTRTGEGQHVRLSMLDTVLAFLWASDMGAYTFRDRPIEPERAASFIDLIYETADGYMTVSTMRDAEWRAFCTAVGREDMIADPRFATAADRDLNVDERLGFVQEQLHARTVGEWMEILTAHTVPCAPALRRRDLLEHPQVLASGILAESEHPVAGPLRQTRTAARFEGTPPGPPRGAPMIGQHTAEVLAEIGYSDEEIAALARSGAAGAASTPEPGPSDDVPVVPA